MRSLPMQLPRRSFLAGCLKVIQTSQNPDGKAHGVVCSRNGFSESSTLSDVPLTVQLSRCRRQWVHKATPTNKMLTAAPIFVDASRQRRCSLELRVDKMRWNPLQLTAKENGQHSRIRIIIRFFRVLDRRGIRVTSSAHQFYPPWRQFCCIGRNQFKRILHHARHPTTRRATEGKHSTSSLEMPA